MSSEVVPASATTRGVCVSPCCIAQWKPLGLAMTAPAQHLVQAVLAALLERATTWQIPANFRAAFGGLGLCAVTFEKSNRQYLCSKGRYSSQLNAVF